MSEDTDAQRRSKKLEQIRLLLERAEGSPYSAEAAACREKAEQLQVAYSIMEWEISKREAQPVLHPEKRHIEVVGPKNVLKESLVFMFDDIARHCRSRAVYTGLNSKPASVTATVVGFPADLDYLEMMFLSVRRQLDNELTPQPNPDETVLVNLVRMKDAGMKWEDIYPLLAPMDPLCPNPTWHRASCVRWGADYTKFCNETGHKRNYTSPQAYQRNFAEGYQKVIASRLSEISAQRYRAERNQAEKPGTGMEIALRDMRQEVDKFATQTFGRTTTSKSFGKGGGKYDGDAAARGREAASRADLGAGGSVKGARKELT